MLQYMNTGIVRLLSGYDRSSLYQRSHVLYLLDVTLSNTHNHLPLKFATNFNTSITAPYIQAVISGSISRDHKPIIFLAAFESRKSVISSLSSFSHAGTDDFFCLACLCCLSVLLSSSNSESESANSSLILCRKGA